MALGVAAIYLFQRLKESEREERRDMEQKVSQTRSYCFNTFNRWKNYGILLKSTVWPVSRIYSSLIC